MEEDKIMNSCYSSNKVMEEIKCRIKDKFKNQENFGKAVFWAEMDWWWTETGLNTDWNELNGNKPIWGRFADGMEESTNGGLVVALWAK